MFESDHVWDFWRCVMCGDRADDLVIAHRDIQRQLADLFHAPTL